MIEQISTNKMVSVKVDLRMRRKRPFIGITFAVMDGNLRIIGTATVNELLERGTAAAKKPCKLQGQTWYFEEANLQSHER